MLRNDSPNDAAIAADSIARAQLRAAMVQCGLAAEGGSHWRISSRLCLSVEHGDYNGTDLFGVGIDRFLHVAARPNQSGRIRVFSANAPTAGIVAFDASTPPDAQRERADDEWSAFPIGAAHVLRDSGFQVANGLDAIVWSEIPGGGMSRSAALSIGPLLAFANEPDALLTDRMRLARLAQRIENEHAGSPCGLLDPLMICHARRDAAVLWRNGSDAPQQVAWGGSRQSLCMLALDTGRSRRGLQNATYPQRVRECAQILATVQPHTGGESLADVVRDEHHERAMAALADSPPELRARLRYLRGASLRLPRMVDAFARGDARELGACMRLDGISLRDDYCISGPELEAMCDIVRAQDGAFGERMLGGGDCGTSGAIVDPARADAILAAVHNEYPRRCPAFAASFATFRCATADGIARMRIL